MKPDFKAMNKQDLRAYVLQHPEDKEAFYELSDRIKANAKPLNSADELPDIMRTVNQQNEL